MIVTLGVACSSESGLVGNGACDAFCVKVDGASCKTKTSHDECIAKCLFYQDDPTASRSRSDPQACSVAESKVLRCATIDGNVGCDGGTGLPHVVGCDPAVAERAGACLPWIAEAGTDESGP